MVCLTLEQVCPTLARECPTLVVVCPTLTLVCLTPVQVLFPGDAIDPVRFRWFSESAVREVSLNPRV